MVSNGSLAHSPFRVDNRTFSRPPIPDLTRDIFTVLRWKAAVIGFSTLLGRGSVSSSLIQGLWKAWGPGAQQWPSAGPSARPLSALFFHCMGLDGLEASSVQSCCSLPISALFCGRSSHSRCIHVRVLSSPTRLRGNLMVALASGEPSATLFPETHNPVNTDVSLNSQGPAEVRWGHADEEVAVSEWRLCAVSNCFSGRKGQRLAGVSLRRFPRRVLQFIKH